MGLRFSLVSAAAIVMALPAGASTSPVGMSVRADPGLTNGIAVFQLAGRGPSEYWCSAGDYAYNKLRVRNGGILTVARPLGAPGGPSNRKSVGFTVSTGGTPNGGVATSVDTVGEARTIASARSLCAAGEQRFQKNSER